MSSFARRNQAGVALAMIPALALVGCSSAQPGTESPSEALPASESRDLLPAAEGTTQYPLTLESPFGSTVLEERPERIAIVTAATGDTDAALALGVTPVFAPSTVDRNTVWLTSDQINSIETLWESQAGDEVPLEEVLATDPDLIVTLSAYDTLDQERFDQLSAIAPVLYGAAGSLSWRETTQMLGETLDLAKAADQIIADYDSNIAQLRQRYPQFEGKTAAFVIVYGEEYGAAYFSVPDSDAALLFEGLGFTLPAEAEQFTENPSVSLELAELIDADFLLLGGFGKDSSYFIDSPIVQQVPAVADGRSVVIEETDDENLPWAIASGSALSLRWASTLVAEEAASVLE